MYYRLTEFGRYQAIPRARQNIQSWQKVKQLLEREDVVSKENVIRACSDHDHSAGPAAYVRHLLRIKWIEEAL